MDITKYKTAYETHESRYRVYLNAYREANIQVRFPVAHEILLLKAAVVLGCTGFHIINF
jgi:hypothetical protein